MSDCTTQTPEAAGWKPLNVAEYESHVQLTMKKGEFDYFAGGANDMVTLKENRAAYNRLRLRPRVLRNVSKINTSTTVLGEKVSSPIGISPTAEHRAAHEDGEKATARAAKRTGTLMAVSLSATTSLEDVAAAGGPSMRRWLQVSLSSRKTRKILEQMVKRAITAGYTALVVSGDRPTLGRREADVRNSYELDRRLNISKVFSSTGARTGPREDGSYDLGQPSDVKPGPQKSLNWDDIRWLRSICGSMKIVVKGILAAEDAMEAVRHGVDAVWVSNHGGRQLDTVAATIEALPEVLRAVNGRCEVYLDGGIRRGTDVLKALALGATAVFVGRPIIWGLAHSGERGATDVINLLNEELVQAMQLAGCTSVHGISPALLAHQTSYYSKL